MSRGTVTIYVILQLSFPLSVELDGDDLSAWKPVVDYYMALDNDATNLPTTRLVFLGDGNVGKTTLKAALQLRARREEERQEVREAIHAEARSAVENWTEEQVVFWLREDVLREHACSDNVIEQLRTATGLRSLKGADLLAMQTETLTAALRGNVGLPSFATTRVSSVLGFLRSSTAELPSARQRSSLPEVLSRLTAWLSPTVGGQPSLHEDDLNVLLRMPHVWTLGVDMEVIALSQEAKFVVWDFAGQAQFLPITRDLLRVRGSILAVLLDGRDVGCEPWTQEKKVSAQTSLRRWLSTIAGCAELEKCQAHVVLIVTRCDDPCVVGKNIVKERAKKLVEGLPHWITTQVQFKYVKSWPWTTPRSLTGLHMPHRWGGLLLGWTHLQSPQQKLRSRSPTLSSSCLTRSRLFLSRRKHRTR